jgi:fatty acid desaturase
MYCRHGERAASGGCRQHVSLQGAGLMGTRAQAWNDSLAEAAAAAEAADRVLVPCFDRANASQIARHYAGANDRRSASMIILQWLVILASAWFAIRSGHWAVYVVAMVVIGTRQQVLLVLVHEAIHNLLFSKRWMNDLVSDLFVAFPVGISTHLYRHSHFQHHRHTNTTADPDFVFQQEDTDQHFPKTPVGFAWLMLKSLMLLNAPRMTRFISRWMPGPNLVGSIPRRVYPLHARILYVVWMIALLTTLTATDLIGDVLILYVAPALLWANVFNRIRSMAEHCGVPMTHQLNSTRTVVPSFLDRLIIAPVGVSYHLEHHLFPYVAGHNLPKLHAELMRDPDYQRAAHVTRSYLGVFRELTAAPNLT